MYDMYDVSYISDRCLSIPQLVLSHMVISVICMRSAILMISMNCPRNMSCPTNGGKPALRFVIQGKMSRRVVARLCLLALHPVAAGGGFCCPFNLGVVTNNPEGVHMGFDTGYPIGFTSHWCKGRRVQGWGG